MVPDRKKVWTDGWMDGRNGRTDGRRQNYIPPTSSRDNKYQGSSLLNKFITLSAHVIFSEDRHVCGMSNNRPIIRSMLYSK